MGHPLGTSAAIMYGKFSIWVLVDGVAGDRLCSEKQVKGRLKFGRRAQANIEVADRTLGVGSDRRWDRIGVCNRNPMACAGHKIGLD